MNKKLEDLKKGQKKSTKLLRRVLKLLSDNMIEKRRGKEHIAYHVSSRQKINVQTDESDALKTTSNDIGTGSQDDVFIDSDIGAIADMGVQAAMKFFTTDKILKKKRARLSRLSQWRSGPMTKVGFSSNAPSKLIYALPPGLADESPKEKLEEFREWIKKDIEDDSSRHIDVAFYHLRKKIRQFPELEQRKVTTVDTFFNTKVEWVVMFEVNTLLIPIHLANLKHWTSVKLDLTNWTIEVYESLQHECPHNFKVREGVKYLSKFIPLLDDRLSLFEFKPSEPL
ncbi:hypothetical protein TIFTF001_007532 [Ficus carica]|uniref:Ubiquitin-like protease family profile domain-containing protein n=1 Tax=Ficus carica TaxID=3494 RepID=A0AA88A357_FICCA|nr:hypothetical protein TIFTF001_007532 [Ficus carica]